MTNTEVVPNIDVPDIRVARISTAPSLSELSELEYHLGYLAGDKGCIYIRLWKNSGNGKIHPGWLALADLENALASVPVESPFKASVLAPLFRGRSTNNLHFSIAALLDCGLLKRADPPGEGYVRNVPDALWKELSALIATSTNLPVPSMGPSAGNETTALEKPVKATKSPKKTAALAANG
jgi:hypothetical protein